MAAGPDDSIYVVDETRDEVLRWSPGEGFFEVAGDGHKGFSGDGGPATKASFDFSWASSLAVGRNGTLYISDTGNGRIRAVSPDGLIQTVVGGGSGPLTSTTAPARAVSLGNSPQWFGLTVGPNGELYVGAGAGVYRLDRGELVRVVGVNPKTYKWPPPPYDYAEPLPVRFDGASRLAFDGKGDLLVGDDAPYDAYELTALGDLRPIGNIRGDASVAPLAEAPDGKVAIGTGTDGFEWFSPSGRITQVTALGAWANKGTGLDKVLGGRGYFRPSNGIAVSTAGDVFIDTDASNGWTSVSAIAEVTLNGNVRAIWRS
jgi:sugar lactone lactonase YvrE